MAAPARRVRLEGGAAGPARPTGRKVPLHEKVARRFWIRRRCPLCGAKAGQDCTDPGEPGGEAVQREHGHDERIAPIPKEREAATKAKHAA
ncbi:hypothetical protein CA983_44265, partial [Streptomyces swartbergensis]